MRLALLFALSSLIGCATFQAAHPDDAIHSQKCVMAMDGGSGQPVMICYAVETCSEPIE